MPKQNVIFDFVNQVFNPAPTPAELNQMLQDFDSNELLIISQKYTDELNKRKIIKVIVELLSILLMLPFLYFVAFNLFMTSGLTVYTVISGLFLLFLVKSVIRFIRVYGEGNSALKYAIQVMQTHPKFKD